MTDEKYPCCDFGKREKSYDKCESCPEEILVNCSISSLEQSLPMSRFVDRGERQPHEIEVTIIRPDGKKLPPLFVDKSKLEKEK